MILRCSAVHNSASQWRDFRVLKVEDTVGESDEIRVKINDEEDISLKEFEAALKSIVDNAQLLK